jgi:sugar phosphate isomerase/epimerase
VCHLGSVTFFWFNPARAIRRYLRHHPDAGRIADDKGYRSRRQKCLLKLRKRMPPFWARVKAGIDDVSDYARQKGVKLGLENREKFEELPVDDDFAEFLAGFPADAPVGYWHDTGHAHLKEGMGLLEHRTHLERLAPRTIGFHLHDVGVEGRDHQPVGSGHIDFEMVSHFWRPGHVLTIELSPRATVDDVHASKERIEALIK